MAKAKSNSTNSTAPGRAPKSVAHPIVTSPDDIARRAYDLYVARGGEPGRDQEDWLRAERELRQANGVRAC